MNKYILLVTGPIGVGKTQLCKYILEKYPLEYVSADFYYYYFFKSDKISDDVAYHRAKSYYSYKLDKFVSNEYSFVLETVMSKKDKIDFIVQCKKNGYVIVCLFLGTCISNLLMRVDDRKNQGWYDVPVQKIYDRYYRTMENFHLLISIVDYFIGIDTTDGYKIGCIYQQGMKLFEDRTTIFS